MQERKVQGYAKHCTSGAVTAREGGVWQRVTEARATASWRRIVRISTVVVSIAAMSMLYGAPALAGPFDLIRIGDRDGFGFTNTVSLIRATEAPHTTPADTNGNGLLEPTEFLPDLDNTGRVANRARDNFDNRTTAEQANAGSLAGSGFTDAGSSGFMWTDIALSTSFNMTFPPPNTFPDSGGPALPNEPTFLFQFHVGSGDIVSGSTLFFNLVVGDYDVTPANVTLTFAASPARTVALTRHPGSQDGLIQAVTTTLTFPEVFAADGSGGWNGFLQADFQAPNEPYIAFDFVELGLQPLPFTPIPEPGSLALIGTGLVGLVVIRTSRRR